MKCFFNILSIFLVLNAVICKGDENNNLMKNNPLPQPLIDIKVLKNNTKDAAERIFKLFKSTGHEIKKSEKHHHHFYKKVGWNIFGLQMPQEANLNPPECICKSSQISTFSSTGPEEEPKIPIFETLYPRIRKGEELYAVETPIVDHYPPLNLNEFLNFISGETVN
jgi:hypothetical protein